MILFLLGITTGFCLFGFAIGVWAKNFEQLQIIPMLVITPLTFLGGAFYSVKALARAVPDDHPVQPDRPSDQRLPLELLLDRRRAGLVERRGDAGDHRRLHGGDRLDVPDRLPAQAVSSGDRALALLVGALEALAVEVLGDEVPVDDVRRARALANRGRSLR